MDKSHLVAVYGTLKSGYGNNRLLRNEEFIGEGITKDKLSMKCYGVPMVFKEPSTAPVFVEVYRVKEKQLHGPLDRLEGHPNLYCRKPTKVIVDDKELVSWLYYGHNRTSDYGKEIKPNEQGIIKWERKTT